MGKRNSHTFKRGDPHNPGRRENRAHSKSGRQPGSLNKFTGDVKQAIIEAINDQRNGGIEWFIKLCEKDRRSASTLLAKLIPTQQIQQAFDPEEAGRKLREQMRAMQDLTQPEPKKEKEKK